MCPVNGKITIYLTIEVETRTFLAGHGYARARPYATRLSTATTTGQNVCTFIYSVTEILLASSVGRL